jgi:hypothetical protein
MASWASIFRAVTTVSTLPAALTAALEGAIDYAGLFPPAALPMAAAIANYDAYLRSPDRWALGRFVVPASRLDELVDGLAASGAEPGPGWRLSVTLDADWRRERQAVETLIGRDGPARVESLEVRLGGPAEVAQLAAALPRRVAGYGEVPWDDRMEPILEALARASIAAKIRMGGTTAALFPPCDRVIDALEAAHRLRLPFKATAGLHHPWRGNYRLTDEPASPTTSMYGYLNLTIAGLLVATGAPPGEALEGLLDPQSGLLSADDDGIAWRGHRFDRDTIRRFRRGSFHGFGSCSFREPMDELRSAVRA